jgi:hypothetical protein
MSQSATRSGAKLMASRIDALTSEVAQLRADNASLLADLVEARKLRDLFKENSLRKEGVIQMLQRKVQRLEGAKPEREPSAMRRAMDAAKAEAMASGRCVTVTV